MFAEGFNLRTPMLIGAHYYAWYVKDKWPHKTLRGHLSQLPITQFEGSWYKNTLSFPDNDIRHLDVVRQHFQWCKQYGIDFLFVSCNNEELLPYLDLAEEVGIKLSIHVETLGIVETLGNTRIKKIEVSDIGKLVFQAMRVRDWFHHPAWFRIANVPVVAYYVTRQISDACLPQAISKIRETLGSVHLFGDEVWWTTPKPERLKLFDTIYAYNMYLNKGQKFDGGKVFNPGAIGEQYLDLIRPYETNFFKVAQSLNVKFAPTVLPGYNDRAVRYDRNHYIIPREQGKFFLQYLNHARQFLDKDSVLLITSFNEWYEDSQIEPVLTAPEGYQSLKTSNDLFMGVDFEPYGYSYLEAVRTFKDSFGRPIRTLPVSLEKGQEIPPKLLEKIPLESLQDKSVDDKTLLDRCALLYYQTTVLPILETDKTTKQDIKKEYFECVEEAHRRGYTVKQIRARAKDLVFFFKTNQNKLIKGAPK